MTPEPLWSRLRRWLLTADTEPVEWMTALGLIAMGLFLLHPVDTFSNILAWSVVRLIFDEYTFGLVLLAAGVFQAIAMLHGSIALRRLCSFINFLVYTFMTITFFLASPTGAAFLLQAVMASGEAWVFLRSPDGKPLI